MAITNTAAQGERGWTLGRNPGAIEQEEAQGQRELSQDSALPTQGLSELPSEWGIVNLGPRDGDPLFTNVTLPEGWKVQPTDHSMWSDLVDASGTKRAEIFYKAAYYDRRARIHIAE